MFKCCECGKKYKTVKAAERASLNGCTKCNGVDIDLDSEVFVDQKRKQKKQEREQQNTFVPSFPY